MEEITLSNGEGVTIHEISAPEIRRFDIEAALIRVDMMPRKQKAKEILELEYEKASIASKIAVHKLKAMNLQDTRKVMDAVRKINTVTEEEKADLPTQQDKEDCPVTQETENS